jgi:hypothetical protein
MSQRVTAPYHIGWRPRLYRGRPRRPWQSEDGIDRFARRAFTAKGAERKMLRDLQHRQRTGSPSLWQRWMTFRRERSGE